MKQVFARIVALALVAVLGLSGCSSSGVSGQITGNYSQDTLTLIEGLRTAINLPDDAPNKTEVQAETRAIINDFASRYRRDAAVSGLSSFTTVTTALNAIAGHYSSYPNRPFPEKLKQRLAQEFKQVESALRRGA
ncbi:photosystem II protein Psb27 [Leptolyngbya sp. PCC 6406]|uniref:photosystem II protein Psb27 n=1 Tax=Leptolyngbya sp. PCC 6406 TaxID=1173264 RepID=UPI00048011A0|nr:photosystem II protein Psb27 [Leptolyngbya sp. PCC 6406]